MTHLALAQALESLQNRAYSIPNCKFKLPNRAKDCDPTMTFWLIYFLFATPALSQKSDAIVITLNISEGTNEYHNYEAVTESWAMHKIHS